MVKKGSMIEDILGSRASVKILKTLAYNKELNISQIISNTRLNHSLASKHLKKLENFNLVQEKRFGRIKIFRYKMENLKARSLKNLIELWEDEI